MEAQNNQGCLIKNSPKYALLGLSTQRVFSLLSLVLQQETTLRDLHQRMKYYG